MERAFVEKALNCEGAGTVSNHSEIIVSEGECREYNLINRNTVIAKSEV